MDVSVVILNYNTFQLTCSCIASVIAQTKGISYEIILVDNASAECDAALFSERFPGIVLVKNPVNSGFAKGNNVGIARAQGDVILLLNSDTELMENSIAICHSELMKQSNTAAISCKLIYPDGALQHNCQSFPSALKILAEKMRLHKVLGKTFAATYLQGLYWNYNKAGFPDWIWGTFFMLKRDALQQLPQKKLNDDFFMYIEDMKWCLDMRKGGMQIAYTPNTTVIHHTGKSPAKSDLVLKNYYTFLNENYSALHKKMIHLLENRN